MLRGFATNLLLTVTLLYQCRAEIDFSSVTLPDWRPNAEYVTQCFYDGRTDPACDWNQRRSEDGAGMILESSPLGLQGDACLEFWYLSPAAANGSTLHALLRSSAGLTEIWSSPAPPRDGWRQASIPLDVIQPGTQVVVEAVSTEGPFTFNRIGVKRGSCGPPCDSDTELWTDESTRCLCSGGRLSCSPSRCPEGQTCGPQTGGPTLGTCTIYSHTDCSTFDGEVFRFVAPCTYTLARTCSPPEAPPTFSVEVINEQNQNSSLHTVRQVDVAVGNFRVSLLQRQTDRVAVNGVWKKLPLSLDGGNVTIRSNPAAVELATRSGLSVSYDNAGAIHITLPSSYSNKVCGLCGNFNQLRADDFRKPDGTIAPDAMALAQSWQTGPTSSSCETVLLPHQCDPLETAQYASESYCGGLLSRTGSFADCLQVLEAESYFRGCVVGMCSTHGDPAVLCGTLQVYADMCQEAGVSVPAWRNSTFCPLECGENSHYNSCAEGCPEVCSGLDFLGSCGSCEERCECDSGFRLSGGECVPAEDCGCWYAGEHYEKGAVFSEGECERQCRCVGDGKVTCTAMRCSDDEVCKVKDGVKDCFPFKPATCSVYGDPHYVTFDGMAYDFQGGCSYTLTTTCGGESSVQFTVIGHNAHPPLQNYTRSKLEAVDLRVGGLHVALNQSGEVHVNNGRVQLPYSTSGPYGSVRVYLRKHYIVLETTFGLRMMIDTQNRLFLQVDERYKYELCGLCGTYSERQDDDLMAPGGQNATGPFEFGDSWKVTGDDQCVSHPNEPSVCDYEEENEAYGECYALLGDAFKACHELVHPGVYLGSCVYDYCATSGDQHTLCESLKSYAAACQVAGVELLGWQTGTACADPPTTAPPPTPPPPTSPTPDQTLCPINCDFEKNLCGWQQLIQDSFDWKRHSGLTPTSLTGPDGDHTTGAGFYMYIEGNSVTHGDSARLWSSMCHYEGPLCLNFWYNMYGSATAMALNIYLLEDNKATKLWTQMNNQGPEWHLGIVEITASGPFQIIVEAIRGSDVHSDVAIDDISIHFGACSGSSPGLVSRTKPPSTTAEVLPSLPVCHIDCSFDRNLCGWNQMMTDAFDWTWQSGSTPTLQTGPSADHTGDGHYLYIEANGASYGDTARLISSECSDSGPQCLQFWYHMYGSADTMGLHVYLFQNRSAEPVWWKRNDQGNMWHLAQVDLIITGAFQIIIEGRRGSNQMSDVAIDDVKLYRGRCFGLSGPDASPPVPSTAPPLVSVTAQPPVVNGTMPPAVEAPTDFINKDDVPEAPDHSPALHSVCQLDCNFEQDLCQWSQLLADVFDWTRHSGSTPSMMTGPSSDHTTGDGHYLYIEGNSASYGDTARLISSECSDSGPQCLQFWYHMYGSADTMGLHVYLFQDRKANSVFWKRNDQGNMWHLAQVDLTTTGAFQIIFEGRRGSNAESDVAIDDVSLHPGHCSVATVGPEFPPANSSMATQPQTSTSPSPQPTSTTTFKTTHHVVPTTQPPITATTTEPPTTARPYPPTTTQLPMESTPITATTTGPRTTARPYPPTTTQRPTESTPITATTTGPPTTARSYPPTTVHPGVETSEQPEPVATEIPQTTARTVPPATSVGSPTTARPYPPTTVHPGVETSDQTDTAVTERPQTTAEPDRPTEQPGVETSEQPEPQVTERPQTAKPEKPATSNGTPTTARPDPPTTEHPGFETSEQTETAVTERPQTTVEPEQPGTSNGPPTTARPYPPTTHLPMESTPITATTTGPPTTARPYPPTTVHPGVETSEQPEPVATEIPQTTARTVPASTSNGPPTTARPYPPTTDHSGVETSDQTETAGTERPQTTAEPDRPMTDQPGVETSEQPGPQVTERPQTAKPEKPATSNGPPTTTRPYPPTTAHPGVETSDQTETAVTERPQTTAEPEQPGISVGPRTTARPHPPTTTHLPMESTPITATTTGPPTTARPYPPTTTHLPMESTPITATTTGPPTTARPYPPTTVHPGVETSEQPGPVATEIPQTTVKTVPPGTSNGPPTTARPYPLTTTHLPLESTPITATTTGPPTTARPYPPTTAHPGFETSEPPTETQPESQTTVKPQLTTTVTPQPTTTAGHQPTTSINPLPTTGRPQPTTTATPHSTTTAKPQPPTTPVSTPSCPENSHYTTCVPPCSPTCAQLNGPPGCREAQGCVQGCVCDEGFVRGRRACVPIQRCGCMDGNGTRYNFNDVWYTDHCSQKCECERDDGVGKIDCDDKDECDGNAVCLQNEEDDYYCRSTGFRACNIRGDPEYRTFDRLRHNFEGEHSYVLVRTEDLPSNLPQVYIECTNHIQDEDDEDEDDDSSSEEDNSRRVRDEDDDDDDDDDHDGQHGDDSDEHEERQKLHRIKIRVYDHTVVFKKNRRLIVDGRRTRTPTSPTAGLHIWEHSSRIYLKTDFGLSVEFDGRSAAEIVLPRLYKEKVGGLCGNFDGKSRNDWMKPDGTVARSLREFGESWRVNG